MASNIFMDAAHSESSEISSVEGNTNQREDKTNVPEHPRLSALKKRARCTAELRHRAVEDRKLRKAQHRPGKILKSRRQESNIRSAEICRAAKGVYIEMLEENIQLEEEEYLQMWTLALDQITANTQLLLKVMHLEEMCRRKDAQESWMQSYHEGNNWTQLYHVGNTVPDEVVDEFFPVSGRSQFEWDHRTDGRLNTRDGDMEMCHWDEGEWMDFEEVNAPMTVAPTAAPAPAVKLDTPVTPKTEKRRGRHYNVDKILLSPTTIVQDEQEGEGEFCGLRL